MQATRPFRPVLARCLASSAILFALLLSGAPARADVPSVPQGHPRVYVRDSDLPAIKDKLSLPEFADAWQQVQKSSEPLAMAFVSLVTGDAGACQAAIDGALAELQASTDARVFDVPMHKGACVYDWCHSLLTDAQKQAFISEFERIAGLEPPGFPADPNSSAVVGHVTEGWLLTGQLPAGMAIYDESKTMYDAAASLFFNRFVPARDYYYPAHMHHQGDSYIGRFAHDLAASWLFRRAGAGNVLSSEQQYVLYQLIYRLRPDGQQLRSGDTFDDSGKSSSKRFMSLLAGSYYQDPYLMTMADSDLFWDLDDIDSVFVLLLRPGGAKKSPLSELPRTKFFAPPMGEMAARTGWEMGADSNDAVVQMRIGGAFFGNHQRKDWGTFQIYYRGPLAISSGVYEGDGCQYGCDHWLNYHHQTISHNGLLIFDPSEKMLLHGDEVANEGGQLWPKDGADHPADLATLTSDAYQLGSVTAYGFGPDATAPKYSHISGDISHAYSSSKAGLVSRSFVTFSTSDPQRPAIVISFDRVVSSNPQFPKTWLLHSIQEPQVEGSTISIVRDGPTYDGKSNYGGKLVVDTLLPEQPAIKKVGGPGKEFWIDSTQTNYAVTKAPPAEPGAWRVEVSPSVAAASDRFLHVMTVMPSNQAPTAKPTMFGDQSLVGVSIHGWVAVFSNSGPLFTANFNLPAGQTHHVLVNDLLPGWWTVRNHGAIVTSQWVTPEAKSLYFESEGGEYTLAPGNVDDGSVAWDAGTTQDASAGEGGSTSGATESGGGEDSGGCGCRTASRGGLQVPGLVGLVMVASLARRRRRRRAATSTWRSAGNP